MKLSRKQRAAERAFRQWQDQVLHCPLHTVPELQWRAFGGRARNRPRPISQRTVAACQQLHDELMSRTLLGPLLSLLGTGNDPGMELAERHMLLDMAYSIPPRKRKESK